MASSSKQCSFTKFLNSVRLTLWSPPTSHDRNHAASSASLKDNPRRCMHPPSSASETPPPAALALGLKGAAVAAADKGFWRTLSVLSSSASGGEESASANNFSTSNEFSGLDRRNASTLNHAICATATSSTLPVSSPAPEPVPARLRRSMHPKPSSSLLPVLLLPSSLPSSSSPCCETFRWSWPSSRPFSFSVASSTARAATARNLITCAFFIPTAGPIRYPSPQRASPNAEEAG
mmetsp:Transcript_67364/g.132065  ORF Transcript_67364/g.132065 Transcript_67364/m.132065 type:complete len:235 (+) Transcript_67364:641-1345(+)